ncbi:hypothetical protein [Deinococcus sp. Marseille-Q6407]|uniref:hypothetical protein n=1 Tax=Deinococcus sp. Marseille-Q6407 TaxID=2969223 RepID=UPI0021C1E4F7|nr:hypothetical protein [Deinococcus sp. Marseille-Q6407]
MKLAPELAPATEKQVVQVCCGRFLLAGWHPVRTEANNVGRGRLKNGKPRPGALPKGFPDYLFTKGLGNGLGLVAYVEFKNAAGGKLSLDQKLTHQNLRQNYGQEVYVVTCIEQAEEIIRLGQKIESLLKAEEAAP